MRRCLLLSEDLECRFQAAGGGSVLDDRDYCYNESISADDDDGCDRAVHKAALTFRHAIHSLNLQHKLFASTDDIIDTTTSSSLYARYIQTHSMMKLTNLRPVKQLTTSDYDDGQEQDDNVVQNNYQLCQQLCTQTWPGQLSLLNERLLQPNNNNNDATNTNNTVTCLNSADIWCDHPTCNQARCGPQGCLRCYRFLPPPVQHLHHQQQQRQQQQLGRNRMAGDLDGPGDILGAWRECTERNYDLVSFVRCGWCFVSLCNEHIDIYNNQKRRNSSSGRKEAVWYKCDECNLSSCPKCISQVFPMQPPQMCLVVTAGKRCGRHICSNCIWAVGKEGDDCGDVSHNIPGGKISNDDSSQVVSIRARDEDGRRRIQLLKEKEVCCSKCLRHVEFRWRELSAVLDMFGGLVP